MFSQPYHGQILQRYHLAASHHPNAAGVLQEFINELNCAFEMPQKFDYQRFLHFPDEIIIDYIRKTHRLYIFKKLPEMEQSLHVLLQDQQDTRDVLEFLQHLFSTFKMALTLHICEEENHMLPYLDFLRSSEENGILPWKFFKETGRYSIKEFAEGHHDDTEKEVADLRKTLLMHCPGVTNASPYRVLLQQLDNFDRDLTIHGLIEDKVLLPKMRQVEERLNFHFQSLVHNN